MRRFWAAKNSGDPGLRPRREGSLSRLGMLVEALAGVVDAGEALGDQSLQFEQAQIGAVQDQAEAEREESQQNNRGSQDRAGDGVDITLGDVFINRPAADGEPEREQDQAAQPKER